MRITVKVVGRYKDVVGRETFQLSITRGWTLRHVVSEVVDKYPQLEREKKFMIVSRNQVYEPLNTVVDDGDSVVLSPPIVGGG